MPKLKVSITVFCEDALGRGAVASAQDVELMLLATDPRNEEAMEDFRPHAVGSWQIDLPNGSTLMWSPIGWEQGDD